MSSKKPDSTLTVKKSFFSFCYFWSVTGSHLNWESDPNDFLWKYWNHVSFWTFVDKKLKIGAILSYFVLDIQLNFRLIKLAIRTTYDVNVFIEIQFFLPYEKYFLGLLLLYSAIILILLQVKLNCSNPQLIGLSKDLLWNMLLFLWENKIFLSKFFCSYFRVFCCCCGCCKK